MSDVCIGHSLVGGPGAEVAGHTARVVVECCVDEGPRAE